MYTVLYLSVFIDAFAYCIIFICIHTRICLQLEHIHEATITICRKTLKMFIGLYNDENIFYKI